MASGYVQNRLMNKSASNKGAIPHLAMYASNSDHPVIRSGFGPREVEHKLTPNIINICMKVSMTSMHQYSGRFVAVVADSSTNVSKSCIYRESRVTEHD